MKTTTKKGEWGEQLAVNYLKSKGMKIVAQRFRHGRNEIDIICFENDTLVFIEVKYRKSQHFGFPEESVTVQKMERIKSCAEEYCLQKDWKGNIRFDILSITDIRNKVEYVLLSDAF